MEELISKPEIQAIVEKQLEEKAIEQGLHEFEKITKSHKLIAKPFDKFQIQSSSMKVKREDLAKIFAEYFPKISNL